MKIAVIIPCYKVTDHILPLLSKFGKEVEHIIVVDDGCPDKTGDKVKAECNDKRVIVLYNKKNGGVGAALKNGYRFALTLDCDIMVKIDGDGQMHPRHIPELVKPIIEGQADYTKGNRFYQPEDLREMPRKRLFANAAHSFFSKMATGYWQMFDPANGYTAIHARVLARLPLEKVSNRYFFESDMLFRLNTLRAVVIDVPMRARYGDETSGLRIRALAWEFLFKSLHNSWRRIAYNYFIRGFSMASLQLIIGKALLLIGFWFGLCLWLNSDPLHAAPAATVMLSALPIIVGFQMVLSFLAYDMSTVPTRPLHPILPEKISLPRDDEDGERHDD